MPPLDAADASESPIESVLNTYVSKHDIVEVKSNFQTPQNAFRQSSKTFKNLNYDLNFVDRNIQIILFLSFTVTNVIQILIVQTNLMNIIAIICDLVKIMPKN